MKMQAKRSVESFYSLMEADFDDIWDIEVNNNLLVALSLWLSKKSDYGENIECLSEAERVFYTVTILEQEVNNGGFEQFFYNDSGSLSGAVVSSYSAIGAETAAEICAKAINSFPVGIPENRIERDEVLDSVFTDEISSILQQCDTEFYSCADDLVELSYRYIMANRAMFTR